MSGVTRCLWSMLAARYQALRHTQSDDRGSVVETVIIAAGMAVLALSVMAAIKILVDQKVAGISL